MSFIHPSLPIYQGNIRLIHLAPKKHDEAPNPLSAHTPVTPSEARVHCSISVARLDDKTTPPYVALSYTWGSDEEKSVVWVDGAPFRVTENLELALHHLTPEADEPPLALWVDAICINQKDEHERTAQVQQLRQTYEEADSVVAWLGAAAENSDAAMNWIQYYGSLAHGLGIGTKTELNLFPLLQALESNPDKLPDNKRLKTFLQEVRSELMSDSTQAEGVRVALGKLLARAYWSRVWVVQEVAHGKSVRFMCGSKAVSEDALHHSLRLLRNFRHFQRLAAHGTSGGFPTNTREPINLLKIRRATGPFPLIYLIRALRFFKSTDPRDRLFALLSLALDAERFGLRADYQNNSTMDVYRSATVPLIAIDGYFDILSLCDTEIRQRAWPSWVPDLTKVKGRIPLQQRSLNRGTFPITTLLQPEFSVSGTKAVSIESSLPRASGSCLTLHARLIDTVDKVGTQWAAGSFRRWVDELGQFSRKPGEDHKSSSLSSKQIRAILRTCVADQEAWRGTSKPRLREEVVEKVQAALKRIDLFAADEETFAAQGVGDYLDQLQDVARYRRPLRTAAGRIGVGPSHAEAGDLVYALMGATVPYLLRRRDDGEGGREGGRLQIVGEAYVHGVMDGEAMTNRQTTKVIKIY